MNLRYALLLIPLLAGCEQLGVETPVQENARREAEGKAMGSGCRQAGRALEDCYQINPKAPKAAIFTGWREMDAYMRENKIEDVKPQFPMKPATSKKKPLESATEEADAPAHSAPAKKDTHEATKPAESGVEAKPADGKPAEAKPAKPAEPGKADDKPIKKTSLPGQRET